MAENYWVSLGVMTPAAVDTYDTPWSHESSQTFRQDVSALRMPYPPPKQYTIEYTSYIYICIHIHIMYSMFMIFYDEIHDIQYSICILSVKYMKYIYHI